MYKKIYGGRYFVYDDGRIYSNISKKFLLPDIGKLGYYQVTLSDKNNKKCRVKVHRLVAMTFLENPSNLPQVNHKDGNKSNNNVSNLEWCTAYHNNKHARDNGLNPIPKSNSKRWEDPDFRRKTTESFRKMHEKIDFKGRKNPNFRYNLLYQGKKYTIGELQVIFGLKQGKAFRLAKRIREGIPCEWTGIVESI